MSLVTSNKALLDGIKSWLGVITVILGGCYSVFEYIEHKQAVKVQRSLAYVEKYRSGDTADAKLSLNQLLIDNTNDLNALLVKKYASNDELSKAYHSYVLNITKPTSTQRNIEVLFSFYEEVSICVERHLCDDEITQSFLANDAKTMFNSYYPYICHLRKQWKNDSVYRKTQMFYLGKDDICM